MKKIITLLAASMMLFGANLFAQTSVNAGYLHSVERTRYEKLTETIPMNGFYAGLDYALPVSEIFSVVPGVYYSLTTGSVAALLDTYRRTDHYLNVPVMAKFNVELSPVFSLVASAGPTLSLLIASSERGSNSKASVDILENPIMKRFDVLLGASVGLNIMDQFCISVGYDWGLLNRYKNLNSHRGQLRAGVSYFF